MSTLCQFVADIAANPTVNLDLNDTSRASGFMIGAPGLDVTPPPLRRAMVATMLRDGDVITASAYENRTVKVPLSLTTGSADDATSAVRNLVRELDKPSNTLRVRIGTTQVFFRTFRSTLALAMARNLIQDAAVTLELPAEPFAWGAEQTAIADATINADPAAGSNPCYVDLSGIKGDVPTPAIITHPAGGLWDSTAAIYPVNMLYAVRRHGTPGSASWFKQIEAFSISGLTHMSALTAATGFSPASGTNGLRFTPPANSTWYPMNVEGPMFDATANTDHRGTYRVLASVKTNTSGDKFELKLRWGMTDAYTNPHENLPVPVALTRSDAYPSSAPCLIDVGLIPVGGPTGYGPQSTYVRAGLAPVITLLARRVSGTGTLDIDYLLYVPADEDLAIVSYNLWPGAGQAANLGGIADGVADLTYATLSGKWLSDYGMAATVGRVPSLTPNLTNRLFVVAGLNVNSTRTKTTTVTVTYFPRYMLIPGASA